MYPYYEADLKAGVIDSQKAAEWIDAVWLKIASLPQSFQNMTLGGCDQDGKFAGNDITLLAMQASRKIAKDQPLISFRYRPDIPPEFWDEILELIRSGLGFPAMFNDEMIFQAKKSAGVDQKDLWKYAIVGCVEPSIPGDEYAKTEQLRVNWAKVIELMLNPGVGGLWPQTSKNLDDITEFEDFYQWYQDELAYFTRLGMRACNLLDQCYGYLWPSPFLSALVKDCVENGCDITRGVLRYSFSSVNGTGMADAVDSLLAVREVVFSKKEMSLSQFAQVVNSGFFNAEPLREKLTKSSIRFGNDTPDSNLMMKRLTDHFVSVINHTDNIYGKKFQAGLYSVDHHANLGKGTGTLPSGRMAGVSLANALSPCQGADVNGPTAVMQSVLQVNHALLGNGMVLDLKFTPQFLMKKQHLDALRALIEAYFSGGGMEVQFNVVNRETLLDAQVHPENHRDLIVRVSGFSAYFINLDRVLQDEIIARTEYAEV